jgi:hypothetical protein
MTTTYEVHLAVYDLSRGMARSLSGQFLGPNHAIEIIPHTGIVVYGKEYFFGGGIQSDSPGNFRASSGLFPISTEFLGRTSVEQHEFEEWCRNCMRNGRWTPQSYDLLERNCNNFTHEAAVEGLKLSRGIPQWILDVPRRFLASPMGQMIRPMLESMQVTGGNYGSSSSSAAPFAHSAPTVGSTAAAAVSPAPATTRNNPWANLPSSASTTPKSTSTDSVKQTDEKRQEPLSTPLLDSFTRPLLSNDTKTASISANKLISSTDNNDDIDALKQMESTLTTNNAKPSEELVESACKAILAQLDKNANVTFGLLLLRLVVLHAPKKEDDITTTCFSKCVHWVHQQLTTNQHALSPAAKSMAWCTLSNLYGVSHSYLAHQDLDLSVEAAIRDLTTSRVEVRQAAAAFLYNVTLVISNREKDEMDDVTVSLLCACLDGIGQETDATCQLRRLIVAAKLVKPNNKDANVNVTSKSLVTDLGFGDALHDLVAKKSSGNATSGDAAKVKQVAMEFLKILQS